MHALGKYIAVIGEGASAFADELAQYFADVVILPPYPLLDVRIASHPDTLLAKVGNALIVSAAYADHAPQTIETIAAHIPVRLGKSVPQSPYPHDVAYNVFCHGGRLYGRADTLDCAVTDAASEQGIPIRHVRQGYAGCAALSCGDAAFTSDPSLADALLADGVAVMRLTPGGIRLPGYDYGFIGGAAGYCAHTAIFFGNIEKHSDGSEILAHLERQKIETLCLGNDVLTDFGGILTISAERT